MEGFLKKKTVIYSRIFCYRNALINEQELGWISLQDEQYCNCYCNTETLCTADSIRRNSTYSTEQWTYALFQTCGGRTERCHCWQSGENSESLWSKRSNYTTLVGLKHWNVALCGQLLCQTAVSGYIRGENSYIWKSIRCFRRENSCSRKANSCIQTVISRNRRGSNYTRTASICIEQQTAKSEEQTEPKTAKSEV